MLVCEQVADHNEPDGSTGIFIISDKIQPLEIVIYDVSFLKEKFKIHLLFRGSQQTINHHTQHHDKEN